ncbi:hypothetical protein [Actinoallomurus spadix]|uniref:hypothetical protein n=1 Tax=Actinoallomurus spadix TaxID=79912 RepID=UPI0020931429|nr:hypothetical protein [Actinoallomurus spadix]
MVPTRAAMASGACADPQLTGFSAPGRIYAGDEVTGTLRLSCAPDSDIQVSLTSDDAKLTVPAQVTVARGRDSVDVPITASTDRAAQYVAHVTAGYAGRTLSSAITVSPGLKLFQIPESTRPNDVSAFLTFTGPVPAGGLTVEVASDDPAVTVPATVAFTQVGSYGGEFRATVRPVARTTTVHISVTLGTRTLTASKVLLPPFDGSSSMKIIPPGGGVYGLDGDRSYTVLLSNPAPDDGLRVDLKVADGDSTIQLDQDYLYITPGSMSDQFRIHASDVTRTTHTEIQATADGVTTTIPVTVQPRLTSITGMPATVQGGQSFQGTVNLAGPSDDDTVVALQQSWGIVDVPTTVTIPAGSTSASFTATTVPVDSPSDVTITASLGDGTADGTVTLTP